MKETLKKVIDDVRSEMPDNRFGKAVALMVLCLVFLIFGKVVFLIATQKPLIFLLIVLIGGAVLGTNVLIKKSKKKDEEVIKFFNESTSSNTCDFATVGNLKQVLVDTFLQYRSEQSYRSLAQMNERIYKLLEKADNILSMDLSFDLVCRMRDIVNRIVLLVVKRSEHKVFNLIAEMDVLNSELDSVIEIKSLQKSILAYINEIPPVLRPEERKDFTIRDAGVNSLLKIDGGHFVVRDRYCTGKIYHDDLPETEWCQLKIRHIEKEGREYYIKFNQIGPLRMFITDPTFHSTQINIKSEKELKQILHQRKKLKVDGTEYALTENFLEHLYKVDHEKLFRNYQFMHGDKILCIEKWHGDYKLVAGRCLRAEDVVIMAIGGGLYCSLKI